MVTMKSLGCTHYALASNKNFADNTKRVVIRVHKDDEFTYVVCSEQLSAELRNCNSSELCNKLTELGGLIIGEDLEVLL